MTISLVVPAYNEEKHVGKCLTSVLEAKIPELLEIIVVNNASTDRTAEEARKFSGVEVISESEKGVTKARQAGIRHASGDIVAFLDSDSEVPEGWFRVISEEFSRDSGLVALSGPCRYSDLSKFHQALVSIFFGLAWPFYFFAGYMALAGNLAVKREALKSVGGFDTQIDFYGDDTDLAKRLHKLGRVKFTRKFFIYTSSRRLADHGIVKSGLIYSFNFLWVSVLGRPLGKKSEDVR